MGKVQAVISKEQAVKILKEKGYNAACNDGIVMVYIRGGQEEVYPTMEAIRKILKDAGYDASFGVKGGVKDMEAAMSQK